MKDVIRQPRLRRSIDSLLAPRVSPKWVEPSWWKPEYDDIPGARLYSERELKAKLARKRYNDKQKALPKVPPTPEQLAAKALKRAEALVKEMHTKINKERARLLLYESLYTSPTLPDWEKVAMPSKINQLREAIPIHERTLARREAELAALKDDQP